MGELRLHDLIRMKKPQIRHSIAAAVIVFAVIDAAAAEAAVAASHSLGCFVQIRGLH